MKVEISGHHSIEERTVSSATGRPGPAMVVERPTRPATPPLTVWKRWPRRIIPPLFMVLVGSAAYITVTSVGHSTPASHFSHVYPPNPAEVERPKVSGSLAPVARADMVRGQRVTSFASLARLVSRGALRQMKPKTWLLARPIAIAQGATLLAVGPGSLEIAPHAYLESGPGGSVNLKGLRISAVDAAGRPLTDPAPGRGFLLAYRGQLVLDHDAISFLGELAPLSYGISMHEPAAGSAVVDCSIDHGYIGVYMTRATGVRVLRNQVTNSSVYGIDPHTSSSAISVEGNHVVGSGVHGIIFAEGVHDSQIVNNVVQNSGHHGIVLFGQADGNVVEGNQVKRSFDGIVVTDSSHNTISSNSIDGQRRFGIRISGQSRGNRIEDNFVTLTLVGAYLYGGATENVLLDNRFGENYEDVRIRADAPGNRVSPVPPKSELPDRLLQQ
jgi:parallel beta-helix repeat protein